MARLARSVATRLVAAAARANEGHCRCQAPTPRPYETLMIFRWPPHRSPIVTGTSVLGITYADGVLLASDMLGGSAPRSLLAASSLTVARCRLVRTGLSRLAWTLVCLMQAAEALPAPRALISCSLLPLCSGSYGSTKRYKDFSRLRKACF